MPRVIADDHVLIGKGCAGAAREADMQVVAEACDFSELGSGGIYGRGRGAHGTSTCPVRAPSNPLSTSARVQRARP